MNDEALLKANFFPADNRTKVERPFTRQYYLFVEALLEAFGDVEESEVLIDHSTGHCHYRGVEYGLTYPRKWIDLIRTKEKDVDFFFSGFLNRERPELRGWVNEYAGEKSVIFFSDNGRRIPRYFFDCNFFGLMSRSKFALCPQGHPYKWTYRFYEAALCRSVPVLREDDLVPDYMDYKFVVHDGKRSPEDILREEREEITEYNYSLALERLFLKEKP